MNLSVIRSYSFSTMTMIARLDDTDPAINQDLLIEKYLLFDCGNVIDQAVTLKSALYLMEELHLPKLYPVTYEAMIRYNRLKRKEVEPTEEELEKLDLT